MPKLVQLLASLLLVAPLVLACSRSREASAPTPAGSEPAVGRDPHSFAHPDEVSVSHLDLDITVDFSTHRIEGTASLTLDNKTGADHLYLDSRGLTIRKVTLDEPGVEGVFSLGDEVEHLGRPVVIDIAPDTRVVHIDYATSPGAEALQWLSGEQTASGKPFLFTQSEAILARTWIPLQDTPGVRMTYDATVHVPPDLLALMSAENPQERNADGVYRFHMPQPIPSYLMALGVGDLRFRSTSDRSGVYAEPTLVDRAAWEFADTEKMMGAAEALYGPYRWGRYDLLLLPPSFPFGGMENPRLTFVTPTVIAGDRSLVALVAHELAHSWSGNLVTNATWNDFWLNEGVTTYIERRIMERLYGKDYADMLWALGFQDLEDTVKELGPDSPDTHLYLDLAGRNPDDGMTDIAYEKGALLLLLLEKTVGRDRWDPFLHTYFDTFAFQTMTTARFLDELKSKLLTSEEVRAVDLDAWVYGPGIPDNAPRVQSAAFTQVEEQIQAWTTGTAASKLDTEGWTTHQWLHFIRNLPSPLSGERMASLDQAFHFTDSNNSEILAAWLEQAIKNGYQAADPALERFLTSMGRRKFLKPLYSELAKTPEGKERALEIYRKARPTYHEISRATIDRILGWKPQEGGQG